MKRIALIHKEVFTDLLRFGKVYIPSCFSSVIDEVNANDNTSVPQAIRNILNSCTQIEYPSQYLIIFYDAIDDNSIILSSVSSLMATNEESEYLFRTQFREDLIIQTCQYSKIFEDYLNVDFKRWTINQGIIAFRSLCGLCNTNQNYNRYVDIIMKAQYDRITYRHHYSLPEECLANPYEAMMVYDRFAPYRKDRIGFFCDVVEIFAYINKTIVGYREAPIERSSIYPLLVNIPTSTPSSKIHDFIKDQPFVKKCDETFYLNGGYLVPLVFFNLREAFRERESFKENKKLIEGIKQTFPEAFDIASIFIGGFFGFFKFYEEYYSDFALPIFRKQLIEETSQPNSVEDSHKNIPNETPLPCEPVEDIQRKQDVASSEIFDINLSPIYLNLRSAIQVSFKGRSSVQKGLLESLESIKTDENILQKIEDILKCTTDKKQEFQELFNVKGLRVTTFKSIRDCYLESINI